MLLLIGLILLIIGITKLSKANTIKKEAYELEQKNDEKLNKLHDRERFILSKEETLSDLNKQITMLKNDIILLKKESSPDSCVKCYTMFLPFLLIKIDVFS